jgi:hypothetical protein
MYEMFALDEEIHTPVPHVDGSVSWPSQCFFFIEFANIIGSNKWVDLSRRDCLSCYACSCELCTSLKHVDSKNKRTQTSDS